MSWESCVCVWLCVEIPATGKQVTGGKEDQENMTEARDREHIWHIRNMFSLLTPAFIGNQDSHTFLPDTEVLSRLIQLGNIVLFHASSLKRLTEKREERKRKTGEQLRQLP